MTGITTYSDYKAGLTEETLSYSFCFGNGNSSQIGGYPSSTHVRQRLGGTPSTAVALSASSAGALMYIPASNSKTMWLTSFEYSFGNAGPGSKSAVSLYDRLSHQGGLVGNITTSQTTNLPTAALPRYTNGEGVMAFIECYQTIGTINTTATITYTNQAGVPGHTSKPFAFITSVNNGPDVLTPIPLQDGDTGVRSVESFQLLGTGTSAGNIGIVLMKKIANGPGDTGSYTERQGFRTMIFGGGPREIKPDACLDIVSTGSAGTTGLVQFHGRIGITER